MCQEPGRPLCPAPCTPRAGAPHQYGLRSCWVIARQSWASSLVAAVDAVPGQALGQEGGGKERPAGQAALGEGQRSDHRRLSSLLSASAFPPENSDLFCPLWPQGPQDTPSGAQVSKKGAGLTGCREEDTKSRDLEGTPSLSGHQLFAIDWGASPHPPHLRLQVWAPDLPNQPQELWLETLETRSWQTTAPPPPARSLDLSLGATFHQPHPMCLRTKPTQKSGGESTKHPDGIVIVGDLGPAMPEGHLPPPLFQAARATFLFSEG